MAFRSADEELVLRRRQLLTRLLAVKDILLLRLLAVILTFLMILVMDTRALATAAALICLYLCLIALIVSFKIKTMKAKEEKEKVKRHSYAIATFAEYIEHTNTLLWNLLLLLLLVISLDVLLVVDHDRRRLVRTAGLLVFGRLMAGLPAVGPFLGGWVVAALALKDKVAATVKNVGGRRR